MNNLKNIFDPKTIAIIGATDRPDSIGRLIMENVMVSQNTRKIYPVNPTKKKILALKSYPKVDALPEPVDLAVIVTPAETVPGLLEECGKFGIKSAIIISAGFKEIGAEGQSREKKIADTIHKYGMRIIGPNCLGVIRPKANLNATFTSKMCIPGNIAFLSQSGALGSAILDWAISRGIGFSAFVSLGSMLDVDFGDLIDFFGEDSQTYSIIIYLESLGNSVYNSRKFMSAARGFARLKPIIILKPGKFKESRSAAKSHTGAMVSEDLYFDAVFERAGVVRVDEIEDLFNCASILNSTQLPKKPDVAIVTNAGGPSVLATDALISRGGQLAQLSEVTTNNLNAFLPAYWSKANPVDILGDADPDRYSRTIDTVLKDDGVSGMVVIYTPQGRASPSEIANAVIAQAKQSIKPIITTFIGDQEVSIARKLFYDNKIPTYDFPESAISTYMYMYRYARNLETLYETPADLPLDASAPSNYLRILIRNMAKKGKTLLTEAVSKKLLTTYGIASTMPYLAMNAEEAVGIAQKIGYPVVMKIASSTIIHKSDSGGVVLNITSATGVKKAFEKIMGNSLKVASREEIEGITIQQMITNYDYELIMGSTKDSLLGPILMFGLGGREAEFFKDLSVGVPPLNQALARRMLEQTKVYKMLSQGFRGKKPVNLLLLDETLVRLSTLIVDFPEIKELDINPLVVTGKGVVALDARVVVDKTVVSNNAILQHTHLIISPYPTKYIQNWICRDGKQVLLRAIKPEDEPMEKELIAALSAESSRFRFFYILKDISHEMLSRFCNIDYEREMAIVAEYNIEGKRRIVGVGRLITESGNETGEFAVLVSDDFQSNGLGVKLLDILIGIGKEKQLGSIYGIVLSDNLKMLGLAKKMGFGEEALSEEETKVVLEL